MTSRFDSAVGLQPIAQTTEVKQPAVKASRFDTAIDRTPEPPPEPTFFDKLLTSTKSAIKPVVQKAKEVIKPVADFGTSILGEKKPSPVFGSFGEGLTPEEKTNANKVLQNNAASAEFENQVKKQRQQEQLKGVGQVAMLASLPLIGPELAAKPVATLLQAGLFSGIDYVANKLNLHASNLAPEDASDKTKLALDVLQMVGEGFLAHGIYKKAPAVADAFTKNVVSTYKLPQQYTIPAATVKDIFQTGTKASPKDLEVFAKITGGDRAKIMSAVKNGLDVTLPAEGVTKLVDKPYWAKIKNTIGIPSTDKILNTSRFGNVIQNTKALIGENSSYVPPIIPPQKMIPGISTPLALEAKNPVAPGTPTQGQGFTMLDKASKPQVASAKLYADYNAAVKSFTANPTPTKLKQVQDLRAQIRAIAPTAPIAPSPAPTSVQPSVPTQNVSPIPTRTQYFHGGENIDNIDMNKSNYAKTFFITDKSDYAQMYAEKYKESGRINNIDLDPRANLIDIKNATPEQIAEIRKVAEGTVTGKILKIPKPDGTFVEVPETPKDSVSFYPYSAKDVIDGAIRGKSHFAENPELVAIYKKLGYDGMVSYEQGNGGAKNIGIWNKDMVKIKPKEKTPTKIPGISKPIVEAPKITSPIKEQGTISKAASDINKTLVSKGFDELPPEQLAQIDSITKEATIKKVNSLTTDYEKAKRMALGQEPLPDNLSFADRQVFFNTVKNLADKNGDHQTSLDLASPISLLAKERALLAQGLGASGFNNNNGDADTFSAIQEITKGRAKGNESKIKTVSESLDAEIKQTKTRPQKQDWNDFIQSIKCK